VDDFRIYSGALTAGEVATFVTPLTAPTGLTASAGDGTATLSWNPSTNATGYNLKRSITNGGPYIIVATNLNALNFIDTGLSNGIVYYYVVSAVNAVAESANSSPASVRPVSMTPPQLSFGLDAGQLHLAWPMDHTGWHVEVQTNELSVGLGTNWIRLLNSTGVNDIFIPIAPAERSVFFRLGYP
jgi:hypothetical protein